MKLRRNYITKLIMVAILAIYMYVLLMMDQQPLAKKTQVLK